MWTDPTTVSQLAANYIPANVRWDNLHFKEDGAYLLALRIALWVNANWIFP